MFYDCSGYDIWIVDWVDDVIDDVVCESFVDFDFCEGVGWSGVVID